MEISGWFVGIVDEAVKNVVVRQVEMLFLGMSTLADNSQK